MGRGERLDDGPAHRLPHGGRADCKPAQAAQAVEGEPPPHPNPNPNPNPNPKPNPSPNPNQESLFARIELAQREALGLKGGAAGGGDLDVSSDDLERISEEISDLDVFVVKYDATHYPCPYPYSYPYSYPYP